MGEKERVLSGTSYVFASTITGMVTALLLRLLLVRYLGIQDYGVLALSISVLAIFALVADLGFSSALPRFVADRLNESRLNRLITAGVVASAAAGSISCAFIFLVSSTSGIVFGMPALPPLLVILGIYLPFSLAALSFLAAINGLRRMRLYSALIVFMHVSGLGITGIVLALGGGLFGAAIATTVSSMVHFAVLLLAGRRYLSWQGLRRVWSDTRELLGFGIKMSATNWTSTLLYQVDIIFLALFTKSDLLVGYYSIAVFMARTLWLVPGSLSVVAYPAISEYWSEGARSRIEGIVSRGLRFGAGIVSVSAVLLAYFGPDVLSILFGAQTRPAYEPLAILILGMAMLGTARSVASGISSAGQPTLGLKISLVGLAASVILNVALIPLFGLVGAALATTLAYGLTAVLLFHFIQKVLRVRLDKRWFVEVSCLVAALGVPGAFLSITNVLPEWVRWLSGLTAASLLAVALSRRLFSKEDLAFVTARLRQAIRGPLPP